jgi:hypothetical protein
VVDRAWHRFACALERHQNDLARLVEAGEAAARRSHRSDVERVPVAQLVHPAKHQPDHSLGEPI